MWRPFTALLAMAALLTLTTALSCWECTPEDIAKCKPEEPKWYQCLGKGRQTLPCACCKSCLNGPGEPCGGFWGFEGKCASHLYCKPNRDQQLGRYAYFVEGTCVYKNENDSGSGSEHVMWK